MFSEPQTLTVNGVAKTLPRVVYGNRNGRFEAVDGTNTMHALSVRHDLSGSRNRRTVKADITKTAEDPLIDGVSRQYDASVWFTINAPKVGFNSTEVQQVAQALIDWLDDPTNLAKLVGGES